MRRSICLNIKRHRFFAGGDNSRLFTAQVNRRLGEVENYFPAVGTRCTCLTWQDPCWVYTKAGRGEYGTRIDCTVSIHGKGCDILFEVAEALLPKCALCQVWWKSVQWLRRKKILNFCYYLNISPWERLWHSVEKNCCITFTHKCFVLSLVEIYPVVLEKKIFNFVSVFSLFCNYLLLEMSLATHLIWRFSIDQSVINL